MSGVRIEARRSVELTMTLGAQEAADLIELLKSMVGTLDHEVDAFCMDLANALADGLRAEGVTVIPRVAAAPRRPGGTLFSQPLFSQQAIVPPDAPEPTEDPTPKPVVVDAREAASVEPRQGRKPIFK